MVELISTWPIWQTIRVLGMVSYLLLFTGICLGILYSMPFWKGKTKAALYKYHSSATVAGVFCGIFHAMLLVIDLHMPFSWKEILIPFASRNEPLWNGLGTLALYGMLIITFTTDIRTKLKKMCGARSISVPILPLSPPWRTAWAQERIRSVFRSI
jgi:hypothetical protein